MLVSYGNIQLVLSVRSRYRFRIRILNCCTRSRPDVARGSGSVGQRSQACSRVGLPVRATPDIVAALREFVIEADIGKSR